VEEICGMLRVKILLSSILINIENKVYVMYDHSARGSGSICAGAEVLRRAALAVAI
jgi:hypothetical protein